MDEQWIENFFLELVQIDSLSLQERQVADRLTVELESLGFTVVEDDAGKKLGGNTGNLIATLAGDPNRKPILLAAHMDTVRPGENIKPHVDENGVVWSDGSTILGADDKAGVTAILAGLKYILSSGIAHGTIQVVFAVAEEIGLLGSKNLQRELVSAEVGLSLDSGGELGTVIIASPTAAKWSATFHGRAAHAGVAPERGISAIKVAAKAVADMPHGRVSRQVTVNVGSFLAEGPTNVVRDKVTLLGEARTLDPDLMEGVIEGIRAGFERTANEAGAGVEFEYHRAYEGFRFEEADAARGMVETAVRNAGFEVQAKESGGGSDANNYTHLGIPTLNIGIGYEEIHSTNEHVRIHDIAEAARVVVEFCKLA